MTETKVRKNKWTVVGIALALVLAWCLLTGQWLALVMAAVCFECGRRMAK